MVLSQTQPLGAFISILAWIIQRDFTIQIRTVVLYDADIRFVISEKNGAFVNYYKESVKVCRMIHRKHGIEWILLTESLSIE